MLEFQDNKKRKIIEETCMEPFCNEVVQILELKVCRETCESLYHYWKAIKEATTAKWGEDSRVTKCLKTKGPFSSGFDPQSFQYARVAQKIEAAKIKYLQEKENERLRAERKARKEEEQRNYQLRKEEEQKQKGEYTKEGNILVPFLNREVPRWKLISVTAGILSLIALATSIPILMLNKSSRTKTPNNVQKIEDIGTKKEITKEPESPTVGKKGIVPSSTPQPGKTSPDEFVKGENAGEKIDSGIKPSPTPLPGETERQPLRETLQPPAPETQAGKRGIGPHGSYGVPGVEKPAGESPKTEVPPKTPSTDTKRWITPESTERRLINGRWYKKRYIESPSGSGRFKEVWVPE